MVVLLRRLGVPSRIVNGFRGGDYNEIAGDIVIRGRDAHSWVEAYMSDSGWVSFDPTPSAVDESQRAFIIKTFNNYLDALELFWAEWVLGYDDMVQVSLFIGSNWLCIVGCFARETEAAKRSTDSCNSALYNFFEAAKEPGQTETGTFDSERVCSYLFRRKDRSPGERGYRNL